MKLKTILTTLVLTGVLAVNSFAAGINVVYNGEPVVFPDAQPKIINDRTMVPIRGLFEKLGFNITWDNVNKMATLRGKRIIISANEETLIANVPNGQFIELDKTTMPVISEGRLYLPLRVIAQTTGCLVNWEADTKTVVIAQPDLSTDNDDDDTAFSDEGNMMPEDQEYLRTVFEYLDEIKEELITSRDPALMKFYNVNGTAAISSSSYDYSKIIGYANNIKELSASERLMEIQGNVNQFADLIINVCNTASDSNIDNATLNAKIADYEQLREGVSLGFSIALVDYFNTRNVAYEKIFTEYCLDLMNY